MPTTEPEAYGPTRNPWDTDAQRRRFERRFGGRGRERHGAGRARRRRRRLDPHPGEHVRPVRPEAVARARLARPRRERRLGRPRRAARRHAQRARQRRGARRARRATCPATRTPRRRRRGRTATRSAPIPAGCASALRTDAPGATRGDRSRVRRRRRGRGAAARVARPHGRASRRRPRSTKPSSSSLHDDHVRVARRRHRRDSGAQLGRDDRPPTTSKPLTWMLNELGAGDHRRATTSTRCTRRSAGRGARVSWWFDDGLRPAAHADARPSRRRELGDVAARPTSRCAASARRCRSRRTPRRST